jgi:hypothetical protein
MGSPDLALLAVALVTGLIGGVIVVLLGGLISSGNETERRKTEFCEKQLCEFYGPMVAIRKEIQARSELHEKLQGTAVNVWVRAAPYLQLIGGTHDKRKRQFGAIIEDDSEAFRKNLLPDYQRMIDMFRDKMWLAESETRAYFGDFVEFVEVWQAFLRGTLPVEVVRAMDHSEKNLNPFYEHLEKTCDRLQKQLKS